MLHDLPYGLGDPAVDFEKIHCVSAPAERTVVRFGIYCHLLLSYCSRLL